MQQSSAHDVIRDLVRRTGNSAAISLARISSSAVNSYNRGSTEQLSCIPRQLEKNSSGIESGRRVGRLNNVIPASPLSDLRPTTHPDVSAHWHPDAILATKSYTQELV